MFYRDHNPPHFHAVYADKLELISGYLPPRVLGLVIEWTALHRKELSDNWERAKRQEPLKSIEPLV
jgi:hypothetical protein